MLYSIDASVRNKVNMNYDAAMDVIQELTEAGMAASIAFGGVSLRVRDKKDLIRLDDICRKYLVSAHRGPPIR